MTRQVPWLLSNSQQGCAGVWPLWYQWVNWHWDITMHVSDDVSSLLLMLLYHWFTIMFIAAITRHMTRHLAQHNVNMTAVTSTHTHTSTIMHWTCCVFCQPCYSRASEEAQLLHTAQISNHCTCLDNLCEIIVNHVMSLNTIFLSQTV